MRITDASVSTFWAGDAPVTLEERVYRFIHELIVTGEANPGSAIVGSAVAARLGVSRITVANALRRLSSEGFVIVHPHRGAEVAALDETTLDEIFRIRYALEAEVMTELAGTIDRVGLARLEDVDAGVRDSLAREDPHAYRQMERRFHLLIYELSGLPMISSLLTDLWNRLEPYRGRRFAEQMLAPEAMDDHERVLLALASGDRDGAIRAMRQHVERGHTHLMGVLHPESRTGGMSVPASSLAKPVRRVRREPPAPPGSLRDALGRLPDARRRQGQMYAIGDILTLCTCAMICGARSRHAAAKWIATASPALLDAVGWHQGRVPSIPTIQRLLVEMDPIAFSATLRAWLTTHGYDLPDDAPTQEQREGPPSLPALGVINALTGSLLGHLQSARADTPAGDDASWRRFFGRMLYGAELSPDATPAELQLRMACLHTAGGDMP